MFKTVCSASDLTIIPIYSNYIYGAVRYFSDFLMP